MGVSGGWGNDCRSVPGVYLGGVGCDGENGVGTCGESGGKEGGGEKELAVHNGECLGDNLRSVKEMGL